MFYRIFFLFKKKVGQSENLENIKQQEFYKYHSYSFYNQNLKGAEQIKKKFESTILPII